MSPRALLSSGILFVGTAVGLTVAVYHFAPPLLDLLLPRYRAELQWLLPSFRIDTLAWRLDRGETVVALTVTLVHPIVVLGRVIPTAGISIDASTLAAHAWVYPVLILSLVAGWPGIVLKHRLWVWLLALPFAFLGLLLDVPLMLWGAVEDELYWQVDHARVAESLGSRVQHFLDGGGRYAVAIGLALLTIVLFRKIASRRTASTVPPPSGATKERARRAASESRP